MEDGYKYVSILLVFTLTTVNKAACSTTRNDIISVDTLETYDSVSPGLYTDSSQLSSREEQTTQLTITMVSRTTDKPTTTATSTTIPSSLSRNSLTSVVPSFKSTAMTTDTQVSTKVTTVHTVEKTTYTNRTSTESFTSVSQSSTSSSLTDTPSSTPVATSSTITTNMDISTGNVSTSSHTMSIKDSKPDSSGQHIAGILVGVLCSIAAIVVVVGFIFYFKRRQKRNSVIENVHVNYESEKFEDITDADYDPISITNTHYEKLDYPDRGENQYTMIVRETSEDHQDNPTESEDDTSSYVLPNEFGVPPPQRLSSKENGVSSRYENTMFSLDLKDDCLPIKDDDDYIQLSEENLKDIRLS
ncbi:uncharacterized protein [Argopecten irradians]|uniref:uncharacterized protein isoform X2 n=1 Tax=Argopecten irradians TaxID=31199 RepID=UPI003715E373